MTTNASTSNKKDISKNPDKAKIFDIKFTLLTIGTILLSFFLVGAFTYWKAFWPFFEISDKSSEIGDTIGGIVNPIIGLLGAVLIYMSFRQQVIVNEQQQTELRNERNFNAYLDIFKEMKNDFEKLKNDNEKYGLDALINFTDILTSVVATGQVGNSLYDPFCNNYMYILHIFNNVFEKVRTSNLDSTDEKLLYEMLAYFYINKLRGSNNKMLHNYERIDKLFKREIEGLEEGHGLLKLQYKFEALIKDIKETQNSIDFIKDYYEDIVSNEDE